MMRTKAIELETGWKDIQDGVSKIQSGLDGEDKKGLSIEEYSNIYTTIYNMCTQRQPNDFSEELYNRYRNVIKHYLENHVVGNVDKKHEEILLRELVKRWDHHLDMVKILSRLFKYLDRYYVQRHSREALEEQGVLCFKESVYDKFKVRARDAVLKMVHAEREGEVVDRMLVRSIIDIYVKVGMNNTDVYREDFENALLEATTLHYSQKSTSWVATDSLPEYMVKSEECLKQEKERVDVYLNKSSEDRLFKTIEKELLMNHATQLLEKDSSGCAMLLRDDKKEDLSRMFRLFSRLGNEGLEPIAKIFKKHIQDDGLVIVKEVEESARESSKKDNSHEMKLVKGFLTVHDKYLEYVGTCFDNHSLFHKALKEAFEHFCNKRVGDSSPAEMLANYCDSLLRKGGAEKMTDEMLEESLEKVVKLLAYINEKDLFGEFFRKKLSRRLLYDKSLSEDSERSILQKLKQQCGAQFTSKMEGMVRDLMLAREMQGHFQEWLDELVPDLRPQIDLSVTVLTTGFWPTYKNIDLTVPDQLSKCVEMFQKYYDNKNKHRKLVWIYSMGHCNVKAMYKKKIELVISPLQAAVLVLFNETDSLTFKTIQETTGIPDEDLGRVMQSLTSSKSKLLEKNAGSNPTDPLYSVNTSFTSPRARLAVPMPPVEDKKKVVEEVNRDRRYAIDAAIVRIMKSRKSLQHQELMSQVMDQLSKMFQADSKQIKKRIEDLISRDYLERDSDDTKMYKYVA